MIMKLPLIKRKNTNDVIKNTGKVSKQKLFLCASWQSGYKLGLMESG